jgi:hypothetical protein
LVNFLGFAEVSTVELERLKSEPRAEKRFFFCAVSMIVDCVRFCFCKVPRFVKSSFDFTAEVSPAVGSSFPPTVSIAAIELRLLLSSPFMNDDPRRP